MLSACGAFPAINRSHASRTRETVGQLARVKIFRSGNIAAMVGRMGGGPAVSMRRCRRVIRKIQGAGEYSGRERVSDKAVFPLGLPQVKFL
jgi:hypothetical protein